MVSAISLIVESKPLASALSLGPFGAQVQPGQEYGGVYPPPFGPSSSSKFPCNDAATLACPLPLKRVERTSDTFEDHLTAWHLGRLEDFATSPYFKAIDILAFETIPLLRETKAIRRAVALFNKERSSVKPFYISHVYPLDKDGNARFPDPFQPTTASNESLVDLVVQASLALIASSETFETPSAVGFNCTNPLRALALVRQLAKSISSHSFACQPWLVVCKSSYCYHPVNLTRLSSFCPTFSTQLPFFLQIRTEEQFIQLKLEPGVILMDSPTKNGRRSW